MLCVGDVDYRQVMKLRFPALLEILLYTSMSFNLSLHSFNKFSDLAPVSTAYDHLKYVITEYNGLKLHCTGAVIKFCSNEIYSWPFLKDTF